MRGKPEQGLARSIRGKPAQSLARSMKAAALMACCGLMLTAFAPASAQEITDPTRPPPGILSGEGIEEAVRGPVLQSIIIRPQRRFAIISGERVEVGSRIAGGARVTAIRETEVVLRSETGTEVLKLYPDVHMKTAQSAARTVRKRSRN